MGMGAEPRIVVVDDDLDIRETLQEYFQGNGFAVETAEGGEQLRALLETDRFDLAILDLRMPGEDGLSLCRFLRKEHDMGIVMLTGSGDSVDRIVGLEVGADDYIAKPFELREVLARVRAVLRRIAAPAPGQRIADDAAEPVTDDIFKFGPLRVDANALHLIGEDGAPSPLTKMEFDLIRTFAERPNRVLTRDFLLETAHGRDWEPFDRSIDVRVTRLRKKIEEDTAEPKYIKTVRGVGYIYHPEGK